MFVLVYYRMGAMKTPEMVHSSVSDHLFEGVIEFTVISAFVCDVLESFITYGTAGSFSRCDVSGCKSA